MDYSSYTRAQLIAMIDELKMLNKELLSEKEQEVRLDFAWSGNLGHWYLNLKTGNVVFNPLKVTTLGYRMDELPEPISYSFFTDKLHPDDYEVVMAAMRQNILGKADVYECEYRIQARDGSWKWFYDRGKVTQRDPAGKAELAAGIVFDITAKKERALQLEHENKLLEAENVTDALTRINNRRAVMAALESLINEARHTSQPISIAMFDIDRFKTVNDTKGHVFGDQVLQVTANIIAGNIRVQDVVGRYGGEEFLVVFPNTDQASASLVCERIRTRIEAYQFAEGLKITISGGIAEYRGEAVTAFIDRADQKLYQAKESGRNRIAM